MMIKINFLRKIGQALFFRFFSPFAVAWGSSHFESKNSGNWKHLYISFKKTFLFTCLFLLASTLGHAQNVGDFQTRPSGVNWPQNWTSNVWQIYQSDGQWHDTTAFPDNTARTVTISSGAEITTNIAFVTIGNLYVKGKLNIPQDFTINTFGTATAPFLFIENGTVTLTSNQTLYLPAGSNVYINITDAATQGIQTNGTCNGNTRVKIGTATFSACNGNGQGDGTFPTINQAAADGTAVANANPKLFCAGTSSVDLTGSKIGNNSVASNIKWELTAKPNGIGTFAATSNTVPFATTVPANLFTAAGDYVFTFSFQVGGKTFQDLVTISVNGPTFTSTPTATTTYCQNNTAIPLSVVASGTGTLTYQWYSNSTNNNTGGTAINGATGSSYTPSTNSAGTVYYYVVVAAGCGVVTSNTAQVIVNPSTATITTQPTASTSYCQNTTATSLTVVGTGVTGYQWYSNTANSNTGGTSISGATSSTYMPPTASAGTVYYYVIVSGNCGAIVSNAVTITVNPLPTASVTGNGQICKNTDAVFNLTGTSGATVTYNINGGSNSTVILAGGTAQVTVPSAGVTQTLNIVSVSNGGCANPASSSASVTVGLDSVYTGSGWSKGIPSNNGLNAIIDSDYTTSGSIINACSCTVNSGKTLTVAANTLMVINNNLTNNGNIIVESDGNLLQVNDTPSPANSGNITVKRDIKISAARNQYNYLGTPVAFQAGQTFKTIYSNIPFVLYHNEANNYFYSSSGVNIPGRGLAVKEPAGSGVGTVTANFIGVPQNGVINFGIINGNTADPNRGYNLVGNPYPSDIDLQKFYTVNGGSAGAKISATFYFWDNNNNTLFQQLGSGYANYTGQAYAIYNVLTGNSGTGTKSQIGTKIPTNIVKIGQGFMTKSFTSSYNLLFNNSIRVGSASSVNFLGKGSAPVQDDRYWLKLVAPSGITTTMAVVHFAAGNNAFGPEDSRVMGGSDALYSVVDAEKLAINGRSSFDVHDRIPLGSQQFVSDLYTIGIDRAEGIFANGQNIYLKDKQAESITNLSTGDYSFAATAGESTGRFEIVYQPQSVLATDDAIKEELSVYRDGSDFVVKAQAKKITSLEVFDASGRMVYQSKPNSATVNVPSATLANGMYILKIDQSGKISNRKILR